MIKKGDRVLYMLTGMDALAINRRRTSGPSIAARMKLTVDPAKSVPLGHAPETSEIAGWPAGAQAHIGNSVREGQTFPGVVVEDFGGDPNATIEMRVNLQVWLDGTDALWVTSATEGDEPGMYRRQH
jgi:hypothetical protein